MSPGLCLSSWMDAICCKGGRSRSGEEQRELGLGKLVSDALWFPSGGAGKSVGYKTPESRGRSELEIWLWEWSF